MRGERGGGDDDDGGLGDMRAKIFRVDISGLGVEVKRLTGDGVEAKDWKTGLGVGWGGLSL